LKRGRKTHARAAISRKRGSADRNQTKGYREKATGGLAVWCGNRAQGGLHSRAKKLLHRQYIALK
jgi:hypothetical protein